jgi:hypothetical protein
MLLVSCYSPEPLPERIENEYEFALPLMDTTLDVMSFPLFSTMSISPDDLLLPSGTVIGSDTKDFPFYVGNWTEKGQTVERVELNLALSYYGLTDGAMEVNLYTRNEGNKEYFWLPRNHEVETKSADYEVVGNPTKTVLTPTQLNTIKGAGRIYFDVGLRFDEEVRGSDLKSSYIRARLSMKVKIKMLLKITW